MCILKAKAQWSVKRQISQGYKEKPKMSKLPQTGEVNLRVGVGGGGVGGGERKEEEGDEKPAFGFNIACDWLRGRRWFS